MLQLEVGCLAASVTLTLKGRLTAYEVREAFDRLTGTLPLVEKRDCYADLLHIQAIDMAGVQLLLALERQILTNGKSLRVLTNEPVAELMRTLGLGRLLASSTEAF
ncbi:STAS domain-containing protein [Stutzerimonas marianensis]